MLKDGEAMKSLYTQALVPCCEPPAIPETPAGEKRTRLEAEDTISVTQMERVSSQRNETMHWK